VDGNKRIAAAVAEIFLEVNGAEMKATNEEVVDLFIKIASGGLRRDEVDKFFDERVVVAL
ncbi:MAG TPA: type II toxin-antitoxin system death-on-curing family toxin, partial [Blastocatellia bacterium]|nr:type II toxin-antitoxin system death-on-curing family toxin [Blastocatellia bacterium]